MVAPKITVPLFDRPVVLNKLQLDQADLPGSQFVRTQGKRYPDGGFSLGRLVAMGLLGAGAGYGVGRYAKSKKPWKGAVVGGAVGAAGSLLVSALSKKDDEVDVIGSMIFDGGGGRNKNKGGLLLVAPASTSAGRRGSKLKVMPIFLSRTETRYPGWAGAIIQHGLLVQKAQMSYVWDHAQYRSCAQVAPEWGYDLEELGWKASGMSATSSTVVSIAPKTYTDKALWTERFAEWPCPAWPKYGIKGEYGRVQFEVRDLLAHHGYSGEGAPVVGGGNQSRRAWRQWIVPGYERYGMPAQIIKYAANNAKRLPGYYDTTARRDAFLKRYSRMMRNAQWFVWAAEMFRIHAGVSLSAVGSDWIHHCQQWGIGCASDDRISSHSASEYDVPAGGNAAKYAAKFEKENCAGGRCRKFTMVTYNSKSWTQAHVPTPEEASYFAKTGKLPSSWTPKDNPIGVDMDAASVKIYLSLVVDATPPPFETPLGEQLMVVHPDVPRWLMDMPTGKDYEPSAYSIGSVLPTVDDINLDFYNSVLNRILAKTTPRSMMITSYVVMTIVSLVSSYATQGAATVVIGAMMTLMMTIFRLAMAGGGKIATADLVRAVGTFVATVVAESGLTETLGKTVDEMLDSFSEVAEVKAIQNQLKDIVAGYESLKNNLQFPYADDLFANSVNIEELVGKGTDWLDKQIDQIY